MKNLKLTTAIIFSVALALSVFTSCQPDDVNTGNGIVGTDLDPSFTITPVENVTNRYTLEAKTITDVTSDWWDIGDGSDVYHGYTKEQIFLPDAGTYTITHFTVSKGGIKTSSSQDLIVEVSDPVAGNLVKGGKFSNSDDYSQWTKLELSADADWVFNIGSATVHSNGGWAQEGIYQAMEVVANKTYSLDMLVKSTGSFTDTWFEVYVGTTVPVIGKDYGDNRIMGLSTWDGCGTAPFSGKLSQVGCIKNSKTNTINNTVTFDTSGTVYLVIRSGGNGFDPAGITISNVELRGTN
ncbi:hypothetical protein EV196_103359 [Mariniflexile fucanivorans]|uniref:PKD domain-containing protein n=1 Tax=Mariniflexile fucanivorans TaxID=264023 RepID=A0A4R1RLL0_9FLAO|nr:hypothetical protein [Mariniflexile fucanivorans]TCL66939.1 hypothetical protein EV196_103359 [Mariniflexile fucanivorans]